MAHRILTVDDDRNTTRVLRRLLEHAGYEVREENDPTQALAAAQEFRPHVVLLDFQMPQLHGGDVAWQLAADPLLRATKLIICSGCAPEQFAHKLPAVPIEVIEKPVEIEQLLKLIERSL